MFADEPTAVVECSRPHSGKLPVFSATCMQALAHGKLEDKEAHRKQVNLKNDEEK